MFRLLSVVAPLALLFGFSSLALADINGNPVVKTEACKDSVFSSIQKICQLVDSLGASCKITADQCVSASQEMYTGSAIELATPTNHKAWNGFGGMGAPYSLATVCLMRDLADQPDKKISLQATASTLLGDISAKQEIGFLSFDKKTKVFEGYHRLKACGPVVGCLDAYTQKFKLTPVMVNTTGTGKKAGLYEIKESHALDFWADGLGQGILVNLPGVMVPTPVGPLSVEPQFRFGRVTGFVLAPYNGNKKTSFADPLLGESANRTIDVYGRNPGTDASTQSPIDIVGGDAVWKYSAKGWLSQVALGSRDANPKNAVWKQPAGVEYPKRGDMDMTLARSDAEKTPNAYLGASIKVEYSLKNLIPPAILNFGCSGFVKICLIDASVFAKPTIDVAYMSQLNILQNEQISWNKKVDSNGITPIPNLFPENMDQSKSASIFAAASTAARFALDAGLDFSVKLIINGLFTKIDKFIVNIHPRTTIAEKIDKGYSDKKIFGARSQAKKILADKKFFQQYVTVTGVNHATKPGDGGVAHIQQCLAKPSEQAPMPPEPTYTPGNPQALVDKIEYPCNICIGWEDIHYVDDSKLPKVEKGQVGTILPAPQTGFAAKDRWTCKLAMQSGCYDMCKMDASGKLSVTRTAIQMLASGEMTDLPPTCKRGSD